MSGTGAFLSAKVASYDLIMVKVIDSPRPQSFRARVERIYTARKGIEAQWLGTEIEFVGCPPNWGQVPLAAGDVALLFVKMTSGRLYEDTWRGHMVVEEIDGELYAIFQHKELWLSSGVPSLLRDCSRQDPRRSYATAIRFDAMEAYLLALIEQTGDGVA